MSKLFIFSTTSSLFALLTTCSIAKSAMGSSASSMSNVGREVVFRAEYSNVGHGTRSEHESKCFRVTISDSRRLGQGAYGALYPVELVEDCSLFCPVSSATPNNREDPSWPPSVSSFLEAAHAQSPGQQQHGQGWAAASSPKADSDAPAGPDAEAGSSSSPTGRPLVVKLFFKKPDQSEIIDMKKEVANLEELKDHDEDRTDPRGTGSDPNPSKDGGGHERSRVAQIVDSGLVHVCQDRAISLSDEGNQGSSYTLAATEAGNFVQKNVQIGGPGTPFIVMKKAAGESLLAVVTEMFENLNTVYAILYDDFYEEDDELKSTDFDLFVVQRHVVFVAAIMLELMRAVADVHKKGMLHGDIKEANVMLEYMPTSKEVKGATLVDFGVAHTDWRSAHPKKIVTPEYKAPELTATYLNRAFYDAHNPALEVATVAPDCSHAERRFPHPRVEELQKKPGEYLGLLALMQDTDTSARTISPGVDSVEKMRSELSKHVGDLEKHLEELKSLPQQKQPSSNSLSFSVTDAFKKMLAKARSVQRYAENILKVDIWSAGIVFYRLLFGSFRMRSRSAGSAFQLGEAPAQRKAKDSVPRNNRFYFDQVKPDSSDPDIFLMNYPQLRISDSNSGLKAMLAVDPKERPTAQEVVERLEAFLKKKQGQQGAKERPTAQEVAVYSSSSFS
ncbi:unnamed protein product [Amoebophrya sp. A25]|nr:unnamed protein product [Amoebophrya sp. A25]|eukprot:GSA25T00003966001.1